MGEKIGLNGDMEEKIPYEFVRDLLDKMAKHKGLRVDGLEGVTVPVDGWNPEVGQIGEWGVVYEEDWF